MTDLWDFIELEMVCIVPMYLRNLLAHNGFDCIDTIKNIDDNDITYLEMYAKCNDYARKVPKDADLKDFYGSFDNAQDRFQIIRGHKILLREIVSYVSQECTKRDFVSFKNQRKIELHNHRSEEGGDIRNDIHRCYNDQNKVVISNCSLDDNATIKDGIEEAIESPNVRQRSLLSSNETSSCDNDESRKRRNSTKCGHADKKPRDHVTDYDKENEIRTKQKKDDANSSEVEIEEIEKNELNSLTNGQVKLPENLLIQTEEAETNKFVKQLEMAVHNDMAHLLSNKLKVTSAAMLNGGKPEQSIINPPKFMWTDDLRELLCEVVAALKQSYDDVTKSRRETLDDFVNQYLSEHVLKIWPDNSMTIKDLEKEYEKSTVKKSKENGRIKFSIPKLKDAVILTTQSNTQKPTADKVAPVSLLQSLQVGDLSSNIDRLNEFRKSRGNSSSSAYAESFKLNFSSKKRESSSDCSRELIAAAIKESQPKKPEGEVIEEKHERSSSKESKSKKRTYDRSPKSASTKNSSDAKRGK